jgi:hypothetical protein
LRDILVVVEGLFFGVIVPGLDGDDGMARRAEGKGSRFCGVGSRASLADM